MKLIFATGNKGKLREAREILGPGYEVLSPADLGLDAEVEETGSTFQENSLIKAKYLYGQCGLPCFADDSGLEVDALGGAPGIYSARYASDHDFSKNIDRVLEELSALEVSGTEAPKNHATLGIVRGGTMERSGMVGSSEARRFLGVAVPETPTFPGAARFRCVATLILEDGTPHFFDGSCEGRIARQRCGRGGFGYDPVFVPDLPSSLIPEPSSLAPETSSLIPEPSSLIPGSDPESPSTRVLTMAELPEDVKNAISHRGAALRKMAEFLETCR